MKKIIFNCFLVSVFALFLFIGNYVGEKEEAKEETKMSVEELRREAKILGYNLIPINVKEKLQPCVCGSKKREHWSSYRDGIWYEQLKCPKCGRKSQPGKTETEARKNWNIMIREEKKKIWQNSAEQKITT